MISVAVNPAAPCSRNTRVTLLGWTPKARAAALRSIGPASSWSIQASIARHWFDPHEAHNLVDDPAHAGVAADLRDQLQTWQRETGDPLLDGIPVPPARAAGVS